MFLSTNLKFFEQLLLPKNKSPRWRFTFVRKCFPNEAGVALRPQTHRRQKIDYSVKLVRLVRGGRRRAAEEELGSAGSRRRKFGGKLIFHKLESLNGTNDLRFRSKGPGFESRNDPSFRVFSFCLF